MQLVHLSDPSPVISLFTISPSLHRHVAELAPSCFQYYGQPVTDHGPGTLTL